VQRALASNHPRIMVAGLAGPSTGKSNTEIDFHAAGSRRYWGDWRDFRRLRAFSRRAATAFWIDSRQPLGKNGAV
jgi:hypothetical protein